MSKRGLDSRSTTAWSELIEAHRTTLVFVNTRRMAERVARELSERLGETPSPPITAAWPRSIGSRPSSGSSAAN